MSFNLKGQLRAEHSHHEPTPADHLRRNLTRPITASPPKPVPAPCSPLLPCSARRTPHRINRIIKRLEEKFGLDDVQATPDPHLTYQLAGVHKLAP